MSGPCIMIGRSGVNKLNPSAGMMSDGTIARRAVHPGRPEETKTACPLVQCSSPVATSDTTDNTSGSASAEDTRNRIKNADRRTHPMSLTAAAAPSAATAETAGLPSGNDTGAIPVVQDAATGSSSLSSMQAIPMTKPQHDESDCNESQSEIEYSLILQRNRQVLLQRMSEASIGGRLTLINLSRRGLTAKDALVLKQAIRSNQQLSVLKLSFNDLGDEGAAVIAEGLVRSGGHHMSLSVLDLGFNGIGDDGCCALASRSLVGNQTIRTVYLSGNNIHEKGALALAGAIMHGCRMTSLHLFANPLGPGGILALARAIAEAEVVKFSHINNSAAVDESSTLPAKLGLQTIEELYLGETAMSTRGFASIPSLILTNQSLRILSLPNNHLDDQAMALLSQAFARNKSVPIEKIRLSFNEISCVGVECLMNALWASETLRELRLDNNLMRDRGAQLAAVGLTSIKLEELDVGFNKIGTLGIKALMKSLSETSSLKTLSLCGIPLDPNASKALKYALAYNSSLRSFYLDNCQIGYAAQRHVVAGIVSNREPSLCLLTGFQIGAISVTLGLPQPLENWSNGQVLRFIHMMWEHNRKQLPHTRSSPQFQEKTTNALAGTETQPEGKKEDLPDAGPAPPAAVVAAAKKALALIDDVGGDALNTEPYERDPSETSPFVPANATLLERSQSGTVRMPPIVEASDSSVPTQVVELWTEPGSETSHGQSQRAASYASFDPAQKQRNLQWLRSHYRSLNEVARLPFDNADLWQLHQYFFSPALHPDDMADVTAGSPSTASTASSEYRAEEKFTLTTNQKVNRPRHSKTPMPSPMPAPVAPSMQMNRSVSFQMLGDAAIAAGVTKVASLKRQSWLMIEDEEKNDSSSEGHEPACKRAKSFKPRIAFYPRIRERLEALRTKPSQEQTLSLLRLLKFVENIIFHDRDIYSDSESIRDPELPTPDDVEMIILDLL